MKLLIVTVSLFILSFSSFAKDQGFVSGIEGNAFVFYGKSQAKMLRYGSKIKDFAEVMVEDGSYVSMTNAEGQTYHLAGGTQVKMLGNLVELKAGKMWFFSNSDKKITTIKSANSQASVKKGQFVLSFDSVKDKTQLLVLSGQVYFSNSLEPDLGVEVSPSYFSFVDMKYNDGLPRRPTRVGLKSYQKLKLSFNGIDEIENSSFEVLFGGQSKKSRSIASVTEKKNQPNLKKKSPKKKGRVIFYSAARKVEQRSPSSVGSAMNYYMNMEKPKKVVPVQSKKVAKVRVFSATINNKQVMSPSPKKKVVNTVKLKNSRMPASVQTNSLIQELNSSFEKSLKIIEVKDQRHPEEVNSLIDDLKSYGQDYRKEYTE